MVKTQELFDEVISLPLETKAKLIDKLLQSIHPVHKEIDELWVTESEKRVDDIKSGKVKTIPGKEVFKKILDR